MKKLSCIVPLAAFSCLFTPLMVRGQLAGSPWPMFHRDPGHSGRSEYVGSQSGKLAWSYRTGSPVESSPAVGFE